MSSSFSSLEEVLGNRDLLQRIARFTLGAANGESETTVPLCLGHTQEWGSLLLVDHFSKDVVSELASTAPLSITFRSPRGLALAASGRFRVRECHLHLESRADMPDLKQAPALCACLRSITLNHWAAVTEEVLEIIKKGCEEEDGTPKLLPKLDTMIIRRVIPPIDALPVQIEHIQLREVLPPYNSTPGGASGLFYLRLQALAGLEALDICYSTEMSTYALKLHSVRLMELLYCPSLQRLRLTVPALHDEADKAMFLGPMFMEQLRTGPLQELDITLVSQIEGDKQEDKQGLARLVQEVCAKAGDVFACTYYGPGEGAHCNDARVILQRRKISRVDTLQGMIRMGQSIGVLQLSEDLTKQVLFSEDMCARVAACGLPVRLRFGWHMTCEECTRLNQLKLRVEGVEWYCKETRGLRALSAPLWKEPEKALRVLRGVDVRGHEKWLPAKFPALAELGLRGRPRASLVPRGCTALSLTYHDVSASTTGLQALKQVRSLRVEHATVTCLPPGITCLELVRCRLVASPRLMEGNTLASLTLDSCSGHGGGSAAGSSNGPPVDLVEWLARTRPHALSVTNTAVSIGTSWADFADQLALSKVASFRFEGCTVVSTLEGTLSQPDGFVDHINRLLDDVFSVVVTPTKGSALYRCSVFRRHSASPEALAAALTAEP